MIQKTLRTYSPKSRRRKFVIDENLYTYLFIQHRDRLSTKESRLNLSPFESLIKGNSPGFLFSSATHSLESIERRFPDESFSPPTGRVLAEKMGELPKSSTYPLTFILIHSLSLPLLSLSLFSVQMSRRSTTKQDIRFAAIDFPQLFTVAQDEFGNRYRIDGFLSDLEKRKTALEILESSSSTCLSRPGWKFGRLFAKYSERCRASNRVL